MDDQTQKMEAIDRLARSVAHDFNNILAAILGSAELLTMKLPAGDPSRDEAEEIRKAAERGVALTRQLLSFTCQEVPQPDALDLGAAVAELMDALRRAAGETVRVRLSACGEPIRAHIEPAQLEQALMNLVINARDAMPGGGTIDIAVSQAGRDARIAVRDTGVGIDPATQPHVFEPYFTTKSPSRRGLGLSIVYRLVKERGGRVTCSAAPNQGTTFELLLPLG